MIHLLRALFSRRPATAGADPLARHGSRLWETLLSQEPLPMATSRQWSGNSGPLMAAAEDEAPARPKFRAARRPRALSAEECPELHEIHRQMDARKADVEGRIAVLSAELEKLKAERDALVPAWNCLQGWVGVHRIQPVPPPEEEATLSEEDVVTA